MLFFYAIFGLNINLKKGFQYFELDFTFTRDDELVCLHDWKRSFKRTFGFDIDGKVTLKEFEVLVQCRSKFTKCTLNGLAVWMRDNPVAYIVTDVKSGRNIEALKRIYDTLPDAGRRVIPQIYNPKNFDAIKEFGYEQIIWTLYRFGGSNDEVLNWVERFRGPIAITMPKERAESTLPMELKKRGIPTYVHTVNTGEELESFVAKFGITEIYTDFLQP